MRGKRHELSALRKTASNLSPEHIKPIIEPVRSDKSELFRTIKELNKNNIHPLIIINPLVGQLTNSSPNDFLNELKTEKLTFLPCIAFNHQNLNHSIQLANQLISTQQRFATYFQDQPTTPVLNITTTAIFNTIRSTPNMSIQFQSQLPRVVKITDSFEAQNRNADYTIHPYFFSDSHLTYRDTANAVGFGDYQIVGEPFTENGGPARAVAIHITYINANDHNSMYIKHCVSTIDNGTTSNTASKFLEALDQLMLFNNQTIDLDQTTLGFQGFIDLHSRRHYPNLGPVKENSMMHHIETISNCLGQ